MVKEKTGFSLDPDMLQVLDSKRGLVGRSAYVNYVLSMIFIENVDAIETLMDEMNYRGSIPEFVRDLLQAKLRSELEARGLAGY